MNQHVRTGSAVRRPAPWCHHPWPTPGPSCRAAPTQQASALGRRRGARSWRGSSRAPRPGSRPASVRSARPYLCGKSGKRTSLRIRSTRRVPIPVASGPYLAKVRLPRRRVRTGRRVSSSRVPKTRPRRSGHDSPLSPEQWPGVRPRATEPSQDHDLHPVARAVAGRLLGGCWAVGLLWGGGQVAAGGVPRVGFDGRGRGVEVAGGSCRRSRLGPSRSGCGRRRGCPVRPAR